MGYVGEGKGGVDLRDVGGLEDDLVGTPSSSLADKVRVCESRCSGCDLNGSTASV